jgi:hypothetical protein
VTFQVLKETSMKITVFWHIAPCSLVETDRCSSGTYCLHHQGNSPRRNVPADSHLQKITNLLSVSMFKVQELHLFCSSQRTSPDNRQIPVCRNVQNRALNLFKAEAFHKQPDTCMKINKHFVVHKCVMTHTVGQTASNNWKESAHA